MSTIFDITLQLIDVQVIKAEDHLQLILVIGLALPAGGGQIAQIPAGVIRVNLGRDIGVKLGTDISEQADTLPLPSKIEVATDLRGVEATAQKIQNLTGNGS